MEKWRQNNNMRCVCIACWKHLNLDEYNILYSKGFHQPDINLRFDAFCIRIILFWKERVSSIYWNVRVLHVLLYPIRNLSARRMSRSVYLFLIRWNEKNGYNLIESGIWFPFSIHLLESVPLYIYCLFVTKYTLTSVPNSMEFTRSFFCHSDGTKWNSFIHRFRFQLNDCLYTNIFHILKSA